MTVIGVLGPLLLRGHDGPVPVPSARQRRLLLGLVARLGTPVSAEELADLGWDDPPVNPLGAVHTNIARVRRLLPDGTRIVTTPEGYRLSAERSAVDVTAFTDHLAAASASPIRGSGCRGWRRRWRCGAGGPTSSWTTRCCTRRSRD